MLVNAQGIKLHKIPLKNYRFDLDAIANAINERTKVVYLCNPNNPTGTIFDREEFETFMNRVQACSRYSRRSLLQSLRKAIRTFPTRCNTASIMFLTLRTFSKAYGMAGVRVGYGLGMRC